MLAHEQEMLAHRWFPVARVQDVGPDGPVAATLLDRRLVVYRAAGGVVVATDRCPHRGARLSAGRMRDQTLECPYHGWRWDGDGSCALVPSQPGAHPAARLATVRSRERFGLVWASLEEPVAGLPSIPETADAEGGWELRHGERFDVRCGLRTITENFRDSSHFAFVHRDTFGDVSPEVPAYTVRAEGHRLEWEIPVTFGSKWAVDDGDRERSSKYRFGETAAGAAAGGGERTLLHYRFELPALSYVYTEHEGGARRLVCQVAAPLDTVATRCRVFFFVAADAQFRGRHGDLDEQVAIETRVFAEDVPIVEEIDPTEAPLDLQGQAHVRADRYSVAYRHLYQGLLDRFGEPGRCGDPTVDADAAPGLASG
ncbi:MAG TPA: aromatic ring-hydroxylating dioxygenase subunit alpha [Actinomycetes bacterium]|nr:aromatic ring-hydroxylating dioxygenase subunit alpha [Actinomycetes bacterium]